MNIKQLTYGDHPYQVYKKSNNNNLNIKNKYNYPRIYECKILQAKVNI